MRTKRAFYKTELTIYHSFQSTSSFTHFLLVNLSQNFLVQRFGIFQFVLFQISSGLYAANK